MQSQLHIPRYIRFQCTGCGHCCHQYPVPLTENDVQRLIDAEPQKAAASITMLTDEEKQQSGLAAFSRALDKPGGHCTFLSESNKCLVQDTAKPSMCKLFPYTFLPCPDGLKVGLSFASSGVLLNQGELLSGQKELLQEQADLFFEMYEKESEDCLEKWSQAEFVSGALIDYPDFTLFNEPYLRRLENLIENPGIIKKDSAARVLSDMFDVLCASLPGDMLNPLKRRYPDVGSKKMDQYILLPLYRAYFAAPAPVQEEEIARAVMTYLYNEERELFFIAGGQKMTFAQLENIQIAPLTAEESDVINRFVYMRLFTRFYFGPGFSMMPLLTGVFHLSALMTLIVVALKIDFVKRRAAGNFEVDSGRKERIIELVRQLDRRLTAAIYSRNTMAMLELFALDNARLKRFDALAGGWL